MSYRKLQITIEAIESTLAEGGARATVIDTQVDRDRVYLALRLSDGTRSECVKALEPQLGEAVGNRNTTVHLAHADSRRHHDMEVWISRSLAREVA